jgi:linoleoyl-CoA desaturase
MSRLTFNNKNNVFFVALKKKVDDYFKDNKIDPSGNFRLYHKTIVLFALAIGSYFTLLFLHPSVWLSLVLCVLLGLTFASIGFNVMHDGAHGSYSKNEWVNSFMAFSLNIMGGSSYMWKIKHNIIHHTYTNIDEVDDDIDIKPWMRVSKTQPLLWFHRFQHIYWVALYGVMYIFWVYYLDFQKYFSGKIGDMKIQQMTAKDHFLFWFSKVVYTFFIIVLPVIKLGWTETLVGYLLMAAVCGIVISTVFQLAHVVEHVEFPLPDVATNKISNEWAVHQIVTTANFATRSKLVSWYVGGLNFQIEHHLFPRVSHIHYPQISRFVKETCAQFNVKYTEFPTVYSAIRSHVHQLKFAGI